MSPKDLQSPFIVLTAVRGGPLDSDVVPVGTHLARTLPGGELHLIHVVEDMPPASPAPRPFGLGFTRASALALSSSVRNEREW
jgi:hypothetical protein